MLIRLLVACLVACSVVALFAAGFFIGQYPAEPAGGLSESIETPLPTIRLISADSKEVDVSAAPESVARQDQSEITLQDESPIQVDSTTPILVSEVPETPVVSTEEKALYIANERLLKELEHQLLNVSRLRDRVADLEWETLNLQSDLLESEVELANTEAELLDTLAAQPTVYNITNVPVGGSVVTRPPPTPVASQNINRPPQPSPPPQPSSESTFYGPAPDRYENLINPGSAEPLNQANDRSN